ncbi:MAG TPA: ABC transporter permease [Bryobacteraceae bacterium]|nr:ABC transporter permease [Bryobacteraceae bacterium]
MPERSWIDTLRKLLPERVCREMFNPSVEDLLWAQAHSQARWIRLRIFFLFLECWRLQLTSPFSRNSRPAAASRPVAPKERLVIFAKDVRHALRLLTREPAFALTAVLTLALGAGASIAVFAVVDAVLFRPFAYQDAERLVILNHRDRRTGITKEFIAIGDYVDLRQRQSSFESLGGFGNGMATVFDVGDPFRVSTLMAAPGLFETLRIRPALGRLLEASDTRPGAAPAMLISYQMWRDQFGSDPLVVGRGLRVDQKRFQIVGVAPPGFQFPPGIATDIIVPQPVPLTAPAARQSDWIFAVARLKSHVSLQTALTDLSTISQQLGREHPRSNAASEYFALPLRDALLGNTKPTLLLIMAAVTIVLLIACSNVANLLLARSLARSREMAVRVALGAGRGRLVAQLLTESLVLAALACSAALPIAMWGARALVALAPKSLQAPGLSDVQVNFNVLAFALGVMVLTSLLIGLFSAVSIGTRTATGVMVSSVRVTTGVAGRRTASALILAEVAFAIMLLTGAGLILRSFSNLVTVNPGFRTANVLTVNFRIPASRYQSGDALRAFYDRAFTALRSVPGVREAGSAMVIPLTGNNWTSPFERPEHPVPAGDRPPQVGWQLASSGYFKALQIPLLEGRFFNPGDRPDGKCVVIISEAIERRFFPEGHAVGHEYKQGNQRCDIVGVVGNIRRAALRDEPRADLYFPVEQAPAPTMTFFVRTAGDPLPLLPLVQSTLRSIEPNILLSNGQTMDEVLSQSLQVTYLALWLMGVFAATALALAAVGIYSVMSYAVRQRTREIGMRVALGATRAGIVWLVIRQGARIALAGSLIGLLAGATAARLFRAMLYGVTNFDPVTLVLAPMLLLLAAIAGCYLPAIRASRVDPAKALAEP